MEPLRRLADRLEEAAGLFAAAQPEVTDPGTAWGAGAASGAGGAWGGQPGAPGEVAEALGQQLTAALHARAREAAAAATRFGGLAAELRVAAAGYTAVDESAHEQTRRLEGS
jgi:hypothetical protein